MGSEFDVDTAVEAVGPGEYAATVADRWDALSGPNGGYLLAICLQALSGEMPLPDPLVVSAYFLRPAHVGPAVVPTEIVRAGRRTATGQVSLVQDDREVLRALATFSDLDRADGRTLVLSEPPVLPPPADCVDPRAELALPGVSIADRVVTRFGRAPGWFRGEPAREPRVEFWMGFADGRDPDLLALPLLVDAAPPVVLDFGERSSTTLELTVHLRARPAPGWLSCRVSTRHVQGGLHEEDFEIWDSTGTLVAQSRQMALLPS
jgi:acyl-CoA thioesterase